MTDWRMVARRRSRARSELDARDGRAAAANGDGAAAWMPGARGLAADVRGDGRDARADLRRLMTGSESPFAGDLRSAGLGAVRGGSGRRQRPSAAAAAVRDAGRHPDHLDLRSRISSRKEPCHEACAASRAAVAARGAGGDGGTGDRRRSSGRCRLKKLTTPEPLPRRGFNVVLPSATCMGRGGEDDVPPAARRALADMRDFLPYKSYKLVDAHG